MSNYEYLISQLDGFTRKFYLNKVIKGILWTTGLVLGLWLVFSLLESQFYFERTIRKFFFYTLLFTGISTLAYWVIRPLLQYFQLGPVISRDRAAVIIGEHFSNVEDKLLNVLQLENSIHQNSMVSKNLIEASIERKASELSITPFKTAIDLSKNRRYLKWVLPPLLIIIGLFIASPSLIKDSTERIIKNNVDYEMAMPFEFVLENDPLIIPENSDIKINLLIQGKTIPDAVGIDLSGFSYDMIKMGIDRYEYTLKNLSKNTSFKFSAGGFSSKEYQVQVVPRPGIIDFQVAVRVPAYTGRSNESFQSIGDLNVPEGSKVSWIFETRAVDSFEFTFNDRLETLSLSGKDRYAISKNLRKSSAYQLKIANTPYALLDSVNYSIQVIKDEYPSITIDDFIDSTDNSFIFYSGTISDDYGLSKHQFVYTIKNALGVEKRKESRTILEPKGSLANFEYMVDVESFDLEPGDQLSYYFEIFDNDGVNGSKSTKSRIYSYRKADVDEMEEALAENTRETLDKMKKRMEESKEIQERLKKLREKLLQKKEADWQDKKDLEKILEEQKKLEKEIENIKKNLEENLEKQEELTPEKEELLEKQKELQELFEEMMDDETKELMEKIEELMNELNKDKMLEMTEEMEFNEEEMEQELDRMMELYKQLDLENRMNKELDKLEQLADKQQELSEKTQEEGVTEENKKEQEEIKDAFDEIKKEMEDIKKENEELESKMPFGDLSEEEQEVDQKLNDSEQNMEKNDAQKASESQQESSESMQKMAQTMKASMEAGAQQQQQEDMEVLRQILENLVTLSFDQEMLIDVFDQTKINTPKYVSSVQEQKKLSDDFQVVEDSLIALSKRNSQIEAFVMEKVGDVKHHFGSSMKSLEDRKINSGQESQQRVMSNINDLALMLSEAMQSMQQQMGKGMPGNQNCNKPGGNSPRPGEGQPKDQISKGQQSLNQKMKDLLKRMQSGGEGGSSKEFAKMAAKQAALRKALSEMEREAQQRGQNGEELRKLMDEMNKIEKDLVNKRLTSEMIRRQEMIHTRLLESERAEREKGKDNKRKSERGKDIARELPPGLEEYLNKRKSEIQEFRKVNPDLTPFYKKMVEDYFESLQN